MDIKVTDLTSPEIRDKLEKGIIQRNNDSKSLLAIRAAICEALATSDSIQVWDRCIISSFEQNTCNEFIISLALDLNGKSSLVSLTGIVTTLI
jgi:hypothetical protein